MENSCRTVINVLKKNRLLCKWVQWHLASASRCTELRCKFKVCITHSQNWSAGEPFTSKTCIQRQDFRFGTAVGHCWLLLAVQDPKIHRISPDVDLESCRSLAKEVSWNKPSLKSSVFISHYDKMACSSLVWLMCLINLKNLVTSFVPLVTDLTKVLSERRKSDHPTFQLNLGTCIRGALLLLQNHLEDWEILHTRSCLWLEIRNNPPHIFWRGLLWRSSSSDASWRIAFVCNKISFRSTCSCQCSEQLNFCSKCSIIPNTLGLSMAWVLQRQALWQNFPHGLEGLLVPTSLMSSM